MLKNLFSAARKLLTKENLVRLRNAAIALAAVVAAVISEIEKWRVAPVA